MSATEAPPAGEEVDPFDAKLLERIGGERLAVGYHNPFLVTDPNLVWLVLRGQVDLYLTPLQDGRVSGTGRHLARFLPGDLIFGAPEITLPEPGDAAPAWHRPGTSVGLRAVATMGSQVYRGDLPRISGEDFDLVTVEWVDRWVTTLGEALKPGTRPTATGPIEADPGVAHDAGTVLNAYHGDVVWVSVAEGSALYLGEATSPMRPGDLPVPISERTWLALPGAATLDATFSPAQLSRRRIWAALRAFHERCMGLLALRLVSEEARRADTWLTRVRERATAFERGVASVGAILDPSFKYRAGRAGGRDDHLIAALRLVAEPLGLEVREPTGDPPGVYSPLDELARASGFSLRFVELREGWWTRDGGPLLGFRNTTELEPVALLPDGPTRYRIIDPVTGEAVRVDAAQAAALFPKAFMLYRPLPREAKGVWDLLRFGVRGTRPDMVTIVVMGLLSALLGLLTPIASGALVEDVLPRSDYAFHMAIIAALAAAAIADAAFDVTQAVALVRVQGRMDSSIQSGIWSRLLSLRAPFFRRFTAGDLADRANGINDIREAISGAVTQSVLGGVFSIVSLGLMLYHSWRLTLVAIGLVVVLVAAAILVFRLSLPHVRTAQQMNGRIQGLVFQLLTGITKLRTSATEGRAFARWSEFYTQERELFHRVERIALGHKLLESVFPVVAMAVLFAFIVWVLDATKPTSDFTVGSFVAFNGAFGQFLAGTLGLVAAMNTIVAAVPLYERLRPILDAPSEAEADLAQPGVIGGEVRLSNVTFRYDPNGPPTLDNVSLKIASGEYVAFVGASGSGKSTILRLVLGFEQPETGALYLDGLDLATLDLRAVRRQIGVVLQNGRLQPGSIFENIVGTAPLTMDDAWEAARLAGLAGDVEAMPMGMQTMLSEGAQGLSGGQRQRLLIARALARKPRLLILDEATSALDNRTQAAVKETLDKLNVTRIVVAHRLSTITDVHRIFVFDQGRLIETGGYTELLARGGAFAALASRQLT